MLYFWFFDGLLALTAFYCSARLIFRGNPSSLTVALGLIMLGLAATAGSLRYGLDLQYAMGNIHMLLSELYASSGHLLIAVGIFSLLFTIFSLRIFILVFIVALVMFFVSHWLWAISPVIFGVIMASCCLVVSARLVTLNRKKEAVILFLATALYLSNGLIIGSGTQLLYGLDIRAAVFHSLLSCWCIALSWVVIRLKNL